LTTQDAARRQGTRINLNEIYVGAQQTRDWQLRAIA
jgi:hypothetical protein